LYYGTLKSEIERIQSAGRIIVFDIDVKGGINLKKIFGDDALSIFIAPPSVEELSRRLHGRGDTSAEMIAKRLAKAEIEMADAPQFDKIIINDDLKQAKDALDREIANRKK
jgi:guanylate kinase